MCCHILLSTCQASPRMLCPSGPRNSRMMQTDWRGSQRGGHEGDQKAGEAALWGKTAGAGSFLLWEEKAQGKLHHSIPQYLKGSYKNDLGSNFTRSHREDKGNRSKLHQERFHLNTRRKFFTVKTVNHWNNIPRDVWSPYCWRFSRCNWTGC